MEEQRGKEGDYGALWVIIKRVVGKNGEQKHFVIMFFFYNLSLLQLFFHFSFTPSPMLFIFLVLTEWMLVLVVLFFFFLLPIHITRQMMFFQNPETKIRFLDSGFSPVSANSRIALSFDLRPSMNDRSK